MMARDAQAACGPRHARSEARRAHRWGKTTGKIGFHGGKVAIERPRLRGFDSQGVKHPLALVEGATENTATVQALIDNLIARGLDPDEWRLFIVDGAKALSKAIRASFGKTAAIQRCQIHKARNIMDRLPKE